MLRILFGRCPAAVLAVFLLLLAACSRPQSPEEEVRAAVKEAAAAVEGKDVKGFMRHVSRDFTDDHGNGYDAVKGIMLRETLRPGALKVVLRGLKVEVDGGTALVGARAFVLRAAGEEGLARAIPEDAEGLKLSVVMRLEDGRWKALSASWEEAGLMGLL